MANGTKGKQDYAMTLFLYSGKTQQEIAERVGVSENTLTAWKKAGNWETMKGALTATKPQLIKDFYQQITLIKESAVDEQGKPRAMTLKETQAIRLITKAIGELDRSLTMDTYVQVMEEFVRWFYEAKPDEAQAFLPWLDRYMKQKFSELS
jgi:transcriptional regulator with XRE-family HTH domain